MFEVGILFLLLTYIKIHQIKYGTWYAKFTMQVFPGNINTYIAELREINPPIIARKIRLIPHSNHPRTICLRLELYGCVWRGTVSPSSLLLLIYVFTARDIVTA